MPNESTVLVIGARGALGSLVVDAFRGAGWRALAGVRRVDGAACARRVDLAEPDSLAAVLDEVDVVVTTVPDSALVAERMVRDRGGVLINLSAMPADAGRRMRREPGESRGTVLLNAGIAPGVTNLVAADLLAKHPDADELELVFTIAVNSTAGPAAADFAHRGLTARTHHDTVTVPLPQPFGERRCLGFAEPDAGWLHLGADGPAIRTYVCFAEWPAQRVMLALNAGRVLARLPKALLRAGSSGKPVREASREPVAHWVGAKRQGKRIGCRTVQGHGDFRMAARSAVLFADALLGRADGRRVAPGVYNPEDLWRLDDLADPLRAAEIRVSDGLLAANEVVRDKLAQGNRD